MSFPSPHLDSRIPLLAAFEQAIVADPRFDLAANLTDLIQVRAVVGFRFAQEPMQT